MLLYQYAALHQTFAGELKSKDPDWLLLFQLHYALIELQQCHPWLEQAIL